MPITGFFCYDFALDTVRRPLLFFSQLIRIVFHIIKLLVECGLAVRELVVATGALLTDDLVQGARLAARNGRRECPLQLAHSLARLALAVEIIITSLLCFVFCHQGHGVRLDTDNGLVDLIVGCCILFRNGLQLALLALLHFRLSRSALVVLARIHEVHEGI